MYTETIDDQELARTQRRYAGFGSRLGAALIDFLVLLPLLAAGFYFTAFAPNLVAVLLITLLSLLYKPLMEHFYGATVGKMALKLRVIDEHGNRPAMATAWLRYTPWLISSFVGAYLTVQVFASPQFANIDGFMDYSMMVGTDPEIVRLSRIQQYTSLLPLLSALVMLFNKPKQAAHDILAKSYVVHRDVA